MFIELNSNNFEDFIKNNSKDKILIVDFWADWCAPCGVLSFSLKKLYGKYSDKLIIAKVDVDKNKDLIEKYNIASIPTMQFYYKGELKRTEIGAKKVSELENIINDILK